mmetsp:Transcript_37818/g.73253  ORF Transcript_37818/g.73253 Transcript_37818/m.73253 type:complete len:119 (-) Transcript_37818:787-1143(-)
MMPYTPTISNKRGWRSVASSHSGRFKECCKNSGSWKVATYIHIPALHRTGFVHHRYRLSFDFSILGQLSAKRREALETLLEEQTSHAGCSLVLFHKMGMASVHSAAGVPKSSRKEKTC